MTGWVKTNKLLITYFICAENILLLFDENILTLRLIENHAMLKTFESVSQVIRSHNLSVQVKTSKLSSLDLSVIKVIYILLPVQCSMKQTFSTYQPLQSCMLADVVMDLLFIDSGKILQHSFKILLHCWIWSLRAFPINTICFHWVTFTQVSLHKDLCSSLNSQVFQISQDTGFEFQNHMMPVLCKGLQGTFLCTYRSNSMDPPTLQYYYFLTPTFSSA